MQMRPTIGFWDIVLYATAMNFGIRWLSTAAAAGPASLLIWILAALGFLAPLAIATAELAGRHEGEGAVYVWTREALGPFAGFICGWVYWTCNLPFFSGLLYFIVGVIATAGGPEVKAALAQPGAQVLLASALAIGVAALHLAGLGVGKWVSNLGAISSLALLSFLVGAGLSLANANGPATSFSNASYLPSFDANGAILWSTMVFAFGGAEGVALLRNDVRGGMASLVRAIGVVGVFLALAYIAGSAAIMAIIPTPEASRLTGLPDAIAMSLAKLGGAGWAPLALGVLAVASLGSYSAWFGVAARLPLAVGIDRYAPAAFAKLHPRTGAPVAAIATQTVIVIVLIVFSQAGATMAAAYDFLVAMSVLSYTLPFVFLFVAYLKAQERQAPAGAWVTPGGPNAARAIGWTGLLVSLSAIACTLVPSPDAADPAGATLKLLFASAVLILSGAGLYALVRARRSATSPGAQ
jgi:glutamate:GABA antiporter